MTWVLFLVLWPASTPAVTTVPGYSTKFECEGAADVAAKEGSRIGRVLAWCVPGPDKK